MNPGALASNIDFTIFALKSPRNEKTFISVVFVANCALRAEGDKSYLCTRFGSFFT